MEAEFHGGNRRTRHHGSWSSSLSSYDVIAPPLAGLFLTPHKHAAALRRFRSNQVLLVQCTENGLASSAGSQYLSWINRYLFQAGYTLLLSHIDKNKKFTSLPENIQAEGIILIENKLMPATDLAAIYETNIPIVAIGGRAPIGTEIAKPRVCVQSNEFAAAYYLTDHLLSQGFRRIQFVEQSSNPSNERFYGYSQCLKDRGIQAPSCLQIPAERLNDEDLKDAALSVSLADALLLANSHLASSMKSIQDTLMLSIPSACFFDEPSANTMNHLATAQHNIEEICRVVVEFLIKASGDRSTSFVAQVPMSYSTNSENLPTYLPDTTPYINLREGHRKLTKHPVQPLSILNN